MGLINKMVKRYSNKQFSEPQVSGNIEQNDIRLFKLPYISSKYSDTVKSKIKDNWGMGNYCFF